MRPLAMSVSTLRGIFSAFLHFSLDGTFSVRDCDAMIKKVPRYVVVHYGTTGLGTLNFLNSTPVDLPVDGAFHDFAHVPSSEPVSSIRTPQYSLALPAFLERVCMAVYDHRQG